MRPGYFLAYLAFVALLVACSGTPPASPSEDGSGGGGGGGGLASVDLTITGGDKAGHYEADITEAGCSTGIAGPNSFTVGSAAVDPAGSFNGAEITIYDASGAAAGTNLFSAAFIFDDFTLVVEVNPYAGQGTGTATLDDRGSAATITIAGTSEFGDQVEATIECHEVTNL